jgi:hypothetical protein
MSVVYSANITFMFTSKFKKMNDTYNQIMVNPIFTTNIRCTLGKKAHYSRGKCMVLFDRISKLTNHLLK